MAGGGAERQLVYLAGELVSRKWDVHVALTKGGPNYDALVSTGCRIHKIPCLNNHDIMILLRLMILIRRIRPQLVQTWMRQMDVLGGIASILTGVPFILSERNCEAAYPLSIKHLLRVCAGRFAVCIISNSFGGSRYWQKMTGSGTRTHIVKNLLPLTRIENVGPSACGIDLPSTSKVLLFAGRFSAQKNIETIIDAFEIVSSQKDVVLLLCGEGELRSRAEELVLRKNLASKVFFLGYVQNVWGLMKRADLFISVSTYEGRPNVVLEAMACCCPLILSDICAHREVIHDGGALFVDPKNTSDLAHAIMTCIENPEISRQMALKAKEEVSSYSIAAITDQYESIYRSCFHAKELKS